MYIYKTTNLITGKVYIGKSAKKFNKKYPQSDNLNFRLIYQKIANDSKKQNFFVFNSSKIKNTCIFYCSNRADSEARVRIN